MISSPSAVRSTVTPGCAARSCVVLAVAPAALTRALHELPTVVDAAVRDLLARLDLTEVAVPDGSTDDIDTWDDAARFGAAAPAPIGG